MRPLDPRLLRYASTTRRFLVVAVLVGAATAALVVAQAILLSDAISGSFQHGFDLSQQTPTLKLHTPLPRKQGGRCPTGIIRSISISIKTSDPPPQHF